MFTTCPNCRMNLAVTAMDLRIGQGYVRCGRCDRVFNALLSLTEDAGDTEPTGLAASGTTSVPALTDAEGAERAPAAGAQHEPRALAETAPESAPEPAPAPAPAADEPDAGDDPNAITGTHPAPPLTAGASIDLADFPAADEGADWAMITPIRTAPAAPSVDVVESQPTGTFETIVLEGDTVLQTEEHVDEDEVDEQIEAIARQIGESAPAQGEAPAAAPVPEAPPVEVQESTGEHVVLGEEAAADVDADAAVGNAPRSHWGWSAAAGALLALLAGQVLHHHRQSLVAHPWFERPLAGLYRAFGVTLEPRWDLGAYDLRQLGGEALGASTTIVLRASVHNRAGNAQPPPMIRAVLQDRFGNALSTTDIPPQDYLRGDAPARMAADQRLDAELTLSDPNRQAVGFELDACLPGADGRLHCSNDP